jgi:hypothetical protein
LKSAPAEDDTFFVNVLRWPALVCVLLSLGCGQKGQQAHAAPRSAATIPAPAPALSPAEATIGEATRAESAGHAAEAVAKYESIAVAAPPARNRVQALMAAARLRLSVDPAVRDLPKARAHLLDAASVDPKVVAAMPATDLLALLDEQTEGQALQEQQEQRAATLRVENRTLRATVKTLQEELAKKQDELTRKDEALHRATEKLLEKAPRPH